jgi:hypothetical protein
LRTGGAQLFSFYNEVLATAMLLIIVVAIGDSNNTPPVEGMAPVILMWRVHVPSPLPFALAYSCPSYQARLGTCTSMLVVVISSPSLTRLFAMQGATLGWQTA